MESPNTKMLELFCVSLPSHNSPHCYSNWMLMYHNQIQPCVKWTYVHIYIYITQESRNTKNTYDFSVQVRNFLLPLSLKVFRHKERERHNLYILAFSSAPLPSRATPAQGLREQAKVNPSHPVSCFNSTN